MLHVLFPSTCQRVHLVIFLNFFCNVLPWQSGLNFNPIKVGFFSYESTCKVVVSLSYPAMWTHAKVVKRGVEVFFKKGTFNM